MNNCKTSNLAAYTEWKNSLKGTLKYQKHNQAQVVLGGDQDDNKGTPELPYNHRRGVQLHSQKIPLRDIQ